MYCLIYLPLFVGVLCWFCFGMHDSNRYQILTTTESMTKIWRQQNAFKPPQNPGGLGCGSVVVNQLFNVLPIVFGSSVFVFVFLCITFFYSSFAIILTRKKELMLLLPFGCLVTVCGSSSQFRGLDCSVWLWHFLIRRTYINITFFENNH